LLIESSTKGATIGNSAAANLGKNDALQLSALFASVQVDKILR
jgi:hypothetical protein